MHIYCARTEHSKHSHYQIIICRVHVNKYEGKIIHEKYISLSLSVSSYCYRELMAHSTPYTHTHTHTNAHILATVCLFLTSAVMSAYSKAGATEKLTKVYEFWWFGEKEFKSS